ncbi:MAG TPA: hypothetical protein VHC22_31205 [Pirellulales bacterium]|nr:hypothetical protein [Pirellulales bacterium]
MPGGNTQSPFAGAKTDGAEAVALRFYDKLIAGEANGAAELFSAKAVGKAKQLREGKASDATVEELKTAFSTMRLANPQPKAMKGIHIVLLEENNSAASPGQSPPGGSNKRKPGKKMQIKVVSEGGGLVIQEIKEH